jgi:hypothetical protein
LLSGLFLIEWLSADGVGRVPEATRAAEKSMVRACVGYFRLHAFDHFLFFSVSVCFFVGFIFD